MFALTLLPGRVLRILNARVYFFLFIFCLSLNPWKPLFSQGRPDEDAMFGNTDQVIPNDNKGKNGNQGQNNDKQNEQQNEKQKDAFLSGEVVDNPLQIGGSFYYRFIASPQYNKPATEMPISLPLQVDAYFDGRPNSRIRVFVDARLYYDATRDAYSQTTRGTSFGSSQNSSTASVSLQSSSIPNNPKVVLDQAWLKFDIARIFFITAGNQHVKWGTSRFWNPTDFINTQKRDPLLPYDLRLGIPMLRAEIPIQKISSNFSFIGFFNQPQPASTAGQLGAAARYELVIQNTEIGLDAVYRENKDFVFGADFSAPLGPFDIYAEAALLTKSPSAHYSLTATPTAGTQLATILKSSDLSTPLWEVSGGINFSFGWREDRQATLGAEYFYNQTGYDGSSIYPILILNGAYQPFYLGKHYAAIYLNAEGPDAGKHTSYTLSVLANISDNSYLARLDFNWQFLTYMNFQLFVAGHFGTKGGEFNFSLNTPALFYGLTPVPAMDVPETLFDAGLSLRTSF